ncbi:SusC/RagA family TonB-linked outer membrane protein [Arcticibacterium luteifluviistationis]|uniref:SusC/RagA family TonB-linked outer membrane protein n=1 Tax=Arcticibacterium luteifluviistationis TaxID=1784714 RepID=A0A2Z4GHA9_9BACT|nr:SusC/RagA family TonB-linked outer membrane protein [Arcticibacterium luteifluviistationis]AWW00701.1 SusC/RagA family TonB-linked outer membrane protein [Arcticibacterium luteifluviistationis]
MIKKLLIIVLIMGVLPAMAQKRTVAGTVTDSDDGSTLSGVSVVIQGTTVGVLTDSDGKYTISAAEGDVLTFSFIGMESQNVKVANNSTLNVTLLSDANQLNAIVVTALGIKREEKTLTYAQQTVSSEELVRTRDPNFMNSLAGKAAGVEIKKSSSGAGGSTKVVLRGNKSLSGDSSPLFVIDGIPMANNRGNQPGMWGGTDQGDGLSAINPEDIESISVLRGSNAAVLYGSQGANGVVLITTKSGVSGKATVTLNSGFTSEQVIEFPELQYKYGAIGNAKESWSTTSGNYDDTFVEDFFQTGHNMYNALTISGGTDKTKAYFSYANTKATGITPNNNYGKNNFSFKQSTKLLNDKITVSSNVILALEKTENRLPAGYYLNPLTGLYMFPRDRDFTDYKDNYQTFNVDRNLNQQNWFVSDHHQSNPYWILNNQPKTNDSKRVIASMSVAYNILDNLTFQVRGNYDYANKLFEQQHAATSNATNVHPNGAWDYTKYDDQLAYADAILTYNTDITKDLSLNTVVGGSFQKTDYGVGVSVATGTVGLLYPNEFFFQNLPTNVQVNSTTNGSVVKQGLFANLQFGLKEFLFLDLSGRNDWASTLALTGNDSYFYPSVGLTGIVSEMFQMPSFITFGKLRASYTQVGNEVPYNRIFPQNTINAGGGVVRNTVKPFFNAKPEIITSLEFGADWRFFHNRLGVDFTYYDITSKDQFIPVPTISGEGGYTTEFINDGEISNKGIELTLSATPYRTNDFEWVTAFNFTRNRNKIVDIGPDDEKVIQLGSSEGFESKLVEGGRFNDIYVLKFQRDDQGRIIFDGGKPLRTATTELIGNLDPKWSLGWNNNFTYKRLNVGILVNGKFGGKVFSQTESMLDGAGVSLRSAEARDAGGVVVNGVDQSTDAAITSVDPETWYRAIGDRNGIGEAYVYDRTNIRVGQLNIGYNLNLSKTKLPIRAASISFIGNNLLFLYKVAPFDPELAMSTNQNAQGLDNFNLPSTRTYGLNLKLTF